MTGNLRTVSFILAEIDELVPFADVEGVELITHEWVKGNRNWSSRVEFLVEGVLPIHIVMGILEFDSINCVVDRGASAIGPLLMGGHVVRGISYYIYIYIEEAGTGSATRCR